MDRLRGGWNFLQPSLFLLLLMQPGGFEAEASHDVTDWTRIEQPISNEDAVQPWHIRVGRLMGKHWGRGGGGCEEIFGIMPCSTSLGGSAWLILTYGYMLLVAGNLLSDGSDLLMEAELSKDLVAGLIMPIIGALPDALLILASGLGASQADAQEDVLVGMGLVAGSSVLLLTALWGTCVGCGRCDLVYKPYGIQQLVAKDKTLTKGFSLTETGVTTDKETMRIAQIMIITLLPYLVAQIPRVFGLKTEGHFFILIAGGIAVLELIGYCTYQIVDPWMQERRIRFARERYMRSHAFDRVSHFAEKQGWGHLFNSNGEPNEEVMLKLFRLFDENNDGHLSEHELKGLLVALEFKRHDGQVAGEMEVKHWMTEFDISNDGKISQEEFIKGITKWMKSSPSRDRKNNSHEDEGSQSGRWDIEAQAAKDELGQLCDNDGDSEDDYEPPSRRVMLAKAILNMVVGVAMAAFFSNPLVDAIGGFSKASGISPFSVSFVATALACSSSEAVSSLRFARKKSKKRGISVAHSQIYGAVTMKNTMCLGVFLAVVYIRQLVWDFSAEVAVIFFATLTIGSVAASRTTFPLWMGLAALALYPLSLGLIYFLDNVCGWH